MINIRNVSKTFNGVIAVDDISFTAEEGENFILLGASGCGKTTSLRMINRLIEPDLGQIFFNGKNILEFKAELLRRKIGYVMQNHGLFSHYTVSENIAVVPKLLGWDKIKIKKRTAVLMEKLKLPPEKYLSAYPSELSGGQQQRVGLARALAADPDVLLMDEPFGALDPVTRVHIRKEFMELDELSRKTIIMVTHDVNEALQLGDRICLMENGKVVQTATAEEILLKPASGYVNYFFGEYRQTLIMQQALLKDLLPLITEHIIPGKPALNFHETASFSDVIQTLSDPGYNNKIAEIKIKDGTSVGVTFDALTEAFQNWKNKKENE